MLDKCIVLCGGTSPASLCGYLCGNSNIIGKPGWGKKTKTQPNGANMGCEGWGLVDHTVRRGRLRLKIGMSGKSIYRRGGGVLILTIAPQPRLSVLSGLSEVDSALLHCMVDIYKKIKEKLKARLTVHRQTGTGSPRGETLFCRPEAFSLGDTSNWIYQNWGVNF